MPAGLLLAVGLLSLAADVGQLRVGSPLEPALSASERHLYELVLRPGDSFHIEVLPLGIDVALRLAGPGGETLFDHDAWDVTEGLPESLHFVAATAGAHTLTVLPMDGAAPPGRYRAELHHLRPATAADRSRATGFAELVEGQRLRFSGTPEGRVDSLERYAGAWTHFRSAGDARLESMDAFVLGGDGASAFVLAPRREIEDAARRFHGLLATGQSSRAGSLPHAAAKLATLVLRPLQAKLRGRRLAIVADGALHYVPFAALPDPSREASLLIHRFEIVQLPSASALAALRERPAPSSAGAIAVFADPVFDPADPRLEAGSRLAAAARSDPSWDALARSARDAGLDGGTLPRLPGTRREAETLVRLAAGGAGLVAVDFDASRERVMAGDLAGFRLLHFATHGFLDSRHPELSGLVLSLVDAQGRPRNGFLSAGDVHGLALEADLAVLSGCQTALGTMVGGEGLLGLTQAFLHAGARRVMASLWRVGDASTFELMSAFYRGLLRERLTPAAALRSAQLGMLEQRRFADPSAWAAFVLHGDWR